MAQLLLRAGLQIVYSRLLLAEATLPADLYINLPTRLRRPAALARAREHWCSRWRTHEGTNGWPPMKVDANSNTEYRSFAEFSLVRPLPGLIGLHLKRRIAVYFPQSHPSSLWKRLDAFDLVILAADRPVSSFLHTVGEAENWNIFARPESDGVLWGIKGKPLNTAGGINMQNTQQISWGRMSGKTSALYQMQSHAVASQGQAPQDYISLDIGTRWFDQHLITQTRPVCPNEDQHVKLRILKSRDGLPSTRSMKQSTLESFTESILAELQQMVYQSQSPEPEEPPAFVQKAEPSDKRVKPRVLYGPAHKRKHWEK